MHFLMMGQWGPKHVGVDVLKHYCNCTEVWAFVGLHCNDWIIMHEMENVKFYDCKADMFRFDQNSSTTYSRFCSTLSSRDGIWNFADVLERHMINNVNTASTINTRISTYYLISRNYSPTHTHTHTHTLNSTPKRISPAICDALLEIKQHGKTVWPTRNISCERPCLNNVVFIKIISPCSQAIQYYLDLELMVIP